MIRWLRGAWVAVRWGWAQGCAERHEEIAARAREREAKARDDYREIYPSPYAVPERRQ